MLDPIGRLEVLEVMEKLVREHGITVINITHHMSEAVRADRIIVIDNGNIIADAPPANIFVDSELIKRAGLELPQSAALLIELSKNGLDIQGISISANDTAAQILDILKD
jgi:energy-coupling factor transport system ATP-binding protein